MSETTDISLDKIDKAEAPTLSIKSEKSVSDQAERVVEYVATRKAIEDETLMEGLSVKKKEGFIHRANASTKREEAESKKSDAELQRAEYDVYSGVAEYAGIKKPLPQKMQKILFTLLCGIQIVVLLVFGLPTSIFTIIADCCDTIMKKLSNIAKSARVLVLSLIGLATIVLALYLVFRVLNINHLL